MPTDTLRYAAIMLVAGIGIPVLAALNARLGARLGAPAAAATILFVVALAGTVVVMALTSGPGPLAAAPDQPRHLFLGGLLVAFYVLSITWVAPKFGIGNAVFFVLLGQMISAAAIDHFGLFGAVQKPMSLMRGSGIALMALGVALTQKA
ncbi:MAG: DMT family transporter [Paracoccaceae bacterium]